MTFHTMEDVNKELNAIKMQNSEESESDQGKLKNSMPTIYPNDYDFNAVYGFGLHSTTSRSFVRPSKALGQEHRNISVPNSLKVHIISMITSIYFIKIKN